MKNVLVVDDDVVVADLIGRALKSYRVTIALNGPEALTRAAMLPPFDLLITDYLMPVMAGDELARRLRASQPGVRTLLLTGFGDLSDADGSATDARLGKPVHIDVLRRTVTELIGQPG